MELQVGNYPWDNAVERGETPNQHVNVEEHSSVEHNFQRACRDISPIMDRFGRIMSDVSVQLWNQVEPGSIRNQNTRNSDPFNSLEARLLSLLRER